MKRTERPNSWAKRRDDVALDDSAFTLIELMVVLLIMAILLAIAIPTFLGTTRSANDRVVQSNLNSALSNADVVYQQNAQAYGTGATSLFASSLVSTLNIQAPSISFTTGPSTGPGVVSLYVSNDGNGLIMAALAKGTNTCWYIMTNTLTQSTSTSNDAYQYLSGYSGFASQVAAGTWFGEAAALGTQTNCVASQPIAFASSSTTAFQTSGFPLLAND